MLGMIELLAWILPVPLARNTRLLLVPVTVMVLPVMTTLLSTGPAANIWVKLLLTASKAVLNGSPVPSLAAAPTSIIFCAMDKQGPLMYLPKGLVCYFSQVWCKLDKRRLVPVDR